MGDAERAISDEEYARLHGFKDVGTRACNYWERGPTRIIASGGKGPWSVSRRGIARGSAPSLREAVDLCVCPIKTGGGYTIKHPPCPANLKPGDKGYQYPSMRECIVPPAPAALDTQVGGDHYKSMAIQPIEFVTRNGLSYPQGCAIKYICRFKQKGGVEDLEKAKHYLDILIEMERDEPIPFTTTAPEGAPEQWLFPEIDGGDE